MTTALRSLVDRIRRRLGKDVEAAAWHIDGSLVVDCPLCRSYHFHSNDNLPTWRVPHCPSAIESYKLIATDRPPPSCQEITRRRRSKPKV